MILTKNSNESNSVNQVPLDFELYNLFKDSEYQLRNRIIIESGSSDSYDIENFYVLLWFTKSNKYEWNLDDIRIPQKYPGKTAYKGKNSGKISSNPLGKNPSDFWDENVISYHKNSYHRSDLDTIFEIIIKGYSSKENDVLYINFTKETFFTKAIRMLNRKVIELIDPRYEKEDILYDKFIMNDIKSSDTKIDKNIETISLQDFF
ncbi:MAG: hypothetical protein INQ03_13775 [Candidatus Heimdallarchaeota archaeon]|nr:hypothetical protein [Candidatus Heimdallarchaeota archaeon]